MSGHAPPVPSWTDVYLRAMKDQHDEGVAARRRRGRRAVRERVARLGRREAVRRGGRVDLFGFALIEHTAAAEHIAAEAVTEEVVPLRENKW